MRQECINELIQTEKAYIEDMSIVHKVFEMPMRESRVVNNTDVDRIFVNWQELIDCNKQFLRDILHRTDSGSDIIGDVISNHVRLKKKTSIERINKSKCVTVTEDDGLHNIL